MNNATYTCSRCNGNGRISAYSNVMGGVCFKCHGTGKQASKPAAKSVKWAVIGSRHDNGAPATLYYVKAKTSAEAVKKASVTFSRASQCFRDEFSMNGAVAVRADELPE